MGRRGRDLGRRRAIHPQGTVQRRGEVAASRHLRDARRADAGGQRQRLRGGELAGNSAPGAAGRHPRHHRGLLSSCAAAWQRRGHPAAADAAITFATLCFGAGIALVGQMYHLPSDWPAGAMLVAIGGLIAAALTGKSGPLVIAFVAMTSWSFGRFEAAHFREVHWSFPAAVRSGFAAGAGPRKSPGRARGRSGAERLAVGAVDALGRRQIFFSLVDGGLALSVAYLAIGLLALDRAGPPSSRRCCHGAPGFRSPALLLKSTSSWISRCLARMPSLRIVYPAFGAALAALAAFAMLARERDSGRLVIIAACAVGLTIPLMFAGLAEADVLRRALVSIAVFVSAVALDCGRPSPRSQDIHCRRLRGVRCVDPDPALADHRHAAEPVAVLPRRRRRAAGARRRGAHKLANWSRRDVATSSGSAA